MLLAERSEFVSDVGGQSIGKFLCELADSFVDKGAAVGGAGGVSMASSGNNRKTCLA